MENLQSIWKWWCELLKWETYQYGSIDLHKWANKTEALGSLSAGNSKT